MHYIAVATDYDGTIAEHGVVDEDTIKALEKLHPAARRLILVTGESWPGWSR
jgi:hydroxymethylpyrimidine pyrophosphatase-like HAD family hydrolase